MSGYLSSRELEQLQAQQQYVENQYSQRKTQQYIIDELNQRDDTRVCLDRCFACIDAWLAEAAKEVHLAPLQELDTQELDRLSQRLMAIVTKLPGDMPLSSVVGQFVGALPSGFKSERAKIQTAAELLYPLAQAGALVVMKTAGNTYQVRPLFALSMELQCHIRDTMYLPPMVCPPHKLHSNSDSPYQTLGFDSVLKGGKHNHHEHETCLEVINAYNQTPLRLELRILDILHEPPPDFDSPERRAYWEMLNPDRPWELELAKRRKQWIEFINQSKHVYDLLDSCGNRFWVVHDYDKRGRVYTRGYHVNVQGNKYKRAIVELYEQYSVEVPAHLKL